MTRSPLIRGAVSLLLVGVCALLAAPGAGAVPEISASGPLAAAGAIGTSVAGAPAATPRPPVGAGALAVRLESVSPAIPTEDDTLVLRGTIANTSDQSVSGVRAVMRLSPTPLASRGEIAEVLEGGGQRTGTAVATSTASADVAASLAPGAAAPFSVSARIADLRFPAAGAYMIGVEALGDSGSGVQRQDLDRTFLPWWPPDADARPLLLTTLWPVTGAPLRDAKGVLLDDQPAVELSPSGRLEVLVKAAEENPGIATVVVDPQVLQAADDLAGGYLVHANGETTSGTRSREVGRWLDTMREVADDADQDLNAMLYANPDVVAARHGRALAALLRQRPLANELTADALGRRLSSNVVLAADGRMDESTLRTLADSKVGTVVLADSTMPVVAPSFFTPSGNITWDSGEQVLPVLLTDSGLGAALRMPLTSSAEQMAARQRLLAETLTTVMELQETQRLLIAAPDPTWSPPLSGATMVLDTLDEAPWITPTSLDRAVAREPSTVAHQLAPYPAEEDSGELPAESVTRARSLTADLAAYSEVLSDPDSLADVTRTAPARILSSWFRGRQEDQDRLVTAISRQVRDAKRSVRIVSNGGITVSGSSGTIPVTVENLGPAAVTVGLTLTADPPQLFTAEPVAPFRIEPDRRTSVAVPAQVNAAGPIRVTIQAVTVQGTPFGVSGSLTVSSSAYANAARLLVQASLALLLVTVLVHGVRRARRRSAPASATEAKPAPAPSRPSETAEQQQPDEQQSEEHQSDKQQSGDVEVPRG